MNPAVLEALALERVKIRSQTGSVYETYSVGAGVVLLVAGPSLSGAQVDELVAIDNEAFAALGDWGRKDVADCES